MPGTVTEKLIEGHLVVDLGGKSPGEFVVLVRGPRAGDTEISEYRRVCGVEQHVCRGGWSTNRQIATPDHRRVLNETWTKERAMAAERDEPARASRAELIEQLQDLAAEMDASPTMSDLRDAEGYPTVHDYNFAFGSWNDAKRAAGLDTFAKEGNGRTYSRTELLELLVECDRLLTHSVTKRDVDASDRCPSATTFQRHFGSWNNAKRAAGLETTPADETPVRYTDEELCNILRSLADNVDGSLTIRDVEEAEGVPDHTTFERRFGSWNRAKQAAGLNPVPRGGGDRRDSYTDEQLCELLRQLTDELGRYVTKTDMDDAEGYPSATTYQRRFGSWREARRHAGLDEGRDLEGQSDL